MSIIHEALNKVEREKEKKPVRAAEPEAPLPPQAKWKFPAIFGKKNLLGVDIGFSTVKLVKLEGGVGGYLLAGAGCESIVYGNAESGESAALSTLVKREGLEGAMVASVFDSKFLVLSQIKLPMMPKSDLREAVRWELKKEIDFHDEAVIDYVINGEIEEKGKKQLSIMAFAARRDEIMAHIELFKGAFLKPYALDVAPMALLSAFDYNYGWNHGKRYAVIDIGASRTTLAILFDKTLRLSRKISIAGNDITGTLQDIEGVDFQSAEDAKLRYMNGTKEPSRLFENALRSFMEDIAREIQNSLIYYNAQYREGSVDSVLICGGCAGIAGLAEYIEETVSVPTATYDAMRGISLKNGLPKSVVLSPVFVEALGLALRRKGR